MQCRAAAGRPHPLPVQRCPAGHPHRLPRRAAQWPLPHRGHPLRRPAQHEAPLPRLGTRIPCAHPAGLGVGPGVAAAPLQHGRGGPFGVRSVSGADHCDRAGLQSSAPVRLNISRRSMLLTLSRKLNVTVWQSRSRTTAVGDRSTEALPRATGCSYIVPQARERQRWMKSGQ